MMIVRTLSVAISFVLATGFASAQDVYRDALVDLGLPGLTEQVVRQFEEAGIPQMGLDETSLRISYTDTEGNPETSEFTVELAQDGRQWQIGLMLRPYMDADRGMLFIFPQEEMQSFWMRNTVIPLDIIYIDAAGKIVNIVQGKPLDMTGLPSTGPAQYVLELNVGTAERLGFGPGDLVQWD